MGPTGAPKDREVMVGGIGLAQFHCELLTILLKRNTWHLPTNYESTLLLLSCQHDASCMQVFRAFKFNIMPIAKIFFLKKICLWLALCPPLSPLALQTHPTAVATCMLHCQLLQMRSSGARSRTLTIPTRTRRLLW